MAKLLTEFVGAFFLMLTLTMTMSAGTLLAPIAVGGVLAALVYMGLHISGAHFNPAVSLAAWMQGRLTARDLASYAGVQILAVALAGLVGMHLIGELYVPEAAEGRTLAAPVGEALFTFVLVLTYLHTALSDATAGNSFFGLAVGFVVIAAMYSVGDISGGILNPAIGLGSALGALVMGDPDHLMESWPYLVGPPAGAALASAAYGAMNKPFE